MESKPTLCAPPKFGLGTFGPMPRYTTLRRIWASDRCIWARGGSNAHGHITAECVLAARRAGVEDAVLASLQASDPGFDWRARSAYNLERMMVHGTRRAAEMREVAATLRDLGLPNRMTSAAAEWQDGVAALRLAPGLDELTERADRVLERLLP